MIYVIEGPDAGGKSTLVKKILQTTIGSRSMHFSAPTTDEEAYSYWKVYDKAIEEVLPGETVVFDRSWISDSVYGPALRGRLEMTPEMSRMLDAKVIAKGGGIIIYCYASDNELWKRCKIRGEDFITTRETLIKIHAGYDEVFSHTRLLPVVKYNTEK